MNGIRRKRIIHAGMGLGCAYLGLKILAHVTQEKKSIDDDNPYLTSSETSKPNASVYASIVKPELDSIVAFFGMIALFPVYAVTAAAVYLDDPGPVLFAQKRVGKDKHYFMLHKVRTMRMDAPHDTPTHLLSDPEQYITGVGRFLRRFSIDELPQLWDVFRQRLVLVGPRPALWNQADLISEREKYGANSVMPGITGLAQINGRDELSIEEKARLDGEYAALVKTGGWRALREDVFCLFNTIAKVVRSEGVVEGEHKI